MKFKNKLTALLLAMATVFTLMTAAINTAPWDIPVVFSAVANEINTAPWDIPVVF